MVWVDSVAVESVKNFCSEANNGSWKDQTIVIKVKYKYLDI